MPSLWLIVCTVLGGTLAAGGANAINMVVDRDIDRLMERTKDRPLVTGAMTPRAALTFAIALEVVAFLFLWATVNLLERGAGRGRLPLLRVRVHALAQAHVQPQHRDRRGGRRGAHPDRLELGHRHPRLGAGGPLRHHLLLDARPTSGPWPSATGTTTPPPTCRCSRWSRACAAPSGPHPRLHAAAVGAHRAVLAGGRAWGTSTSGSAIVLGGDLHLVRRPARSGCPIPGLARERRRAASPRSRCGPPRCACSPGRSPTSRCCSGPWRSISWCGPDGDDRPRRRQVRRRPGFVTRFPSATRPLPRCLHDRHGRRSRRRAGRPHNPRQPPRPRRVWRRSSAPATTRSSAGSGSPRRCSTWCSPAPPRCSWRSCGSTRADLDNDFFAQAVTLRSIGGAFLFLLPLTIGLATLVVPLQVGRGHDRLPPGGGRGRVDLPPRRWARRSAPTPSTVGPSATTPTASACSSSAFLLVLAGAGAWRGSASAPRCSRSGPPGMSLRRVPLFAWSSLVARHRVGGHPAGPRRARAGRATSTSATAAPNGFISGGGAGHPLRPHLLGVRPAGGLRLRHPGARLRRVGGPRVQRAPATSSTASPWSSSAPTACSPSAPGPCPPSAPTPSPGSTRRRGWRCRSPILAAGARPRSGCGRSRCARARPGWPARSSTRRPSVLMLLVGPGHRCPAGHRADRDAGRRRGRRRSSAPRHHVGRPPTSCWPPPSPPSVASCTGRPRSSAAWSRRTAPASSRSSCWSAPSCGAFPDLVSGLLGQPGVPRHARARQHRHHRGAQHRVGHRRRRARRSAAPRSCCSCSARSARRTLPGDDPVVGSHPRVGHQLAAARRQLRQPPRDHLGGAALRRPPQPEEATA